MTTSHQNQDVKTAPVSGVARIFHRSDQPLEGAKVCAYASKGEGLDLEPKWVGYTRKDGTFGPIPWRVRDEITLSLTHLGYQETQTHTIVVPPEGINHSDPTYNIVFQVPANWVYRMFKLGMKVPLQDNKGEIVITAAPPRGTTINDIPHGLPGVTAKFSLFAKNNKEEKFPTHPSYSLFKIVALIGASAYLAYMIKNHRENFSAVSVLKCLKNLSLTLMTSQGLKYWFYLALAHYFYRTEPLHILIKLLIHVLQTKINSIQLDKDEIVYWDVLKKSGVFLYKTKFTTQGLITTTTRGLKATSEDGGVSARIQAKITGTRGVFTLYSDYVEFNPITAIFRPNVLIMVPPGVYGGALAKTAVPPTKRYPNGPIPDGNGAITTFLKSLLISVFTAGLIYQKYPNRYLSGLVAILTQELSWHILFKMACKMSKSHHVLFGTKAPLTSTSSTSSPLPEFKK